MTVLEESTLPVPPAPPRGTKKVSTKSKTIPFASSLDEGEVQPKRGKSTVKTIKSDGRKRGEFAEDPSGPQYLVHVPIHLPSRLARPKNQPGHKPVGLGRTKPKPGRETSFQIAYPPVKLERVDESSWKDLETSKRLCEAEDLAPIPLPDTEAGIGNGHINMKQRKSHNTRTYERTLREKAAAGNCKPTRKKTPKPAKYLKTRHKLSTGLGITDRETSYQIAHQWPNAPKVREIPLKVKAGTVDVNHKPYFETTYELYYNEKEISTFPRNDDYVRNDLTWKKEIPHPEEFANTADDTREKRKSTTHDVHRPMAWSDKMKEAKAKGDGDVKNKQGELNGDTMFRFNHPLWPKVKKGTNYLSRSHELHNPDVWNHRNDLDSTILQYREGIKSAPTSEEGSKKEDESSEVRPTTTFMDATRGNYLTQYRTQYHTKWKLPKARKVEYWKQPPKDMILRQRKLNHMKVLGHEKLI